MRSISQVAWDYVLNSHHYTEDEKEQIKSEWKIVDSGGAFGDGDFVGKIWEERDQVWVNGWHLNNLKNERTIYEKNII